MNKRGKFIVLYGQNGIGKTTQARRITRALLSEGKTVVGIKYARYDLAPTGAIINGYLRCGNPERLTPREFQILQMANRLHYERMEGGLHDLLHRGTVVVAEDYIGTSIAWGEAYGVRADFIKKINAHLVREDLAIFLSGEAFSSGVEKAHLHENDRSSIYHTCRTFAWLARKYGWVTVNANRPEEEVHRDIMDAVRNIL
ncbi:MAG: hypothetical protein AAB819_01445 [Patescibacteria group bacterium]